MPLFKHDGGLVEGVEMTFYKDSTPVAKSTDWDECTHKKWHQQLVPCGVATKFQDVLADLTASFADNSEFFQRNLVIERARVI